MEICHKSVLKLCHKNIFIRYDLREAEFLSKPMTEWNKSPESHKVTPSCQLLTDYSQGDGGEAGGEPWPGAITGS